MRRISRLVVTGCVVASLLGACSSSGSTGKVTGSKVLSKSEYIAQADAICRSYSGKIDSVVSGSGSGLTVEQQKQIFRDKLIPLFRGELIALSDLRPPKADQARIDEFRINMSQAINTIVAGVNAAKSVADLRDIKPSGLVKFKQQATAYGMKYC
jgi:hypothetical protein